MIQGSLVTVLHDFEVSLFALETETCYHHMMSRTTASSVGRAFKTTRKIWEQNYTKDMGSFIIPETMEQNSMFGAIRCLERRPSSGG